MHVFDGYVTHVCAGSAAGATAKSPHKKLLCALMDVTRDDSDSDERNACAEAAVGAPAKMPLKELSTNGLCGVISLALDNFSCKSRTEF